ncbi:hypothetical protein [Hufsiella ginkgonis]|uniref:Cupin domain-containing protein n=1 Tax=Hufsiella ginkgonis TaxID=2695274 RepID=A0A7K1Y017_9SPHI|nr:hypothetical protein [Hufsiella ginkgonis]MXV16615.1 hypothetical protein [Hufsiella ginkgonis]
MTIQEYIDSGILESYCLGMLTEKECAEVELACARYPAIKRELNRIQVTLENYAQQNAILPDPQLKFRIMEAIADAERQKHQSLDDLPLIHARSNYLDWLKYLEGRIPVLKQEGRIVNLLRNNKGVMQMLLVSSTDFEDEVHDELAESFLILEGECECTVNDDVFKLQAGGFTRIPLYAHHSVKILSPYVVAVLQRVSL